VAWFVCNYLVTHYADKTVNTMYTLCAKVCGCVGSSELFMLNMWPGGSVLTQARHNVHIRSVLLPRQSKYIH